MPVEDIDISPDEFANQIAFNSIDPPMAERLEFMIAQLTACFVAVNSKKGKAPKPSEFMLSTMMHETTHQDTDIETKIRATFSLFPSKSK